MNDTIREIISTDDKKKLIEIVNTLIDSELRNTERGRCGPGYFARRAITKIDVRFLEILIRKEPNLFEYEILISYQGENEAIQTKFKIQDILSPVKYSLSVNRYVREVDSPEVMAEIYSNAFDYATELEGEIEGPNGIPVSGVRL